MTDPSKPSDRDKTRLRVLLADASPENAKRFGAALERLSFVELVGEAENSEQTLSLFFKLRPDVVVVSIILSELDGLEVLRCVKQAAPQCAVILTSFAPQNFLGQAATLLGATALCSAEDGCAQLERVLDQLWKGR